MDSLQMMAKSGNLPCAEFRFFCQLPPELRLKIWSYNLPATRIVGVHCGTDDLSFSSPVLLRPRPRGSGECTSSARIPANLHACAESRAEALRVYRHMFGIARGPSRIAFSPDRDFLYFGPRKGYMASQAQLRTVLSLASTEDLARVRRVAISDALFWIDARRDYISVVAAGLTVDALNQIRLRMPNVQELVFVPRDQHSSCGKDKELVEPTSTHLRMRSQIKAAIRTVCQQHPEWVAPRWSIMELTSEPESHGDMQMLITSRCSAGDKVEPCVDWV